MVPAHARIAFRGAAGAYTFLAAHYDVTNADSNMWWEKKRRHGPADRNAAADIDFMRVSGIDDAPGGAFIRHTAPESLYDIYHGGAPHARHDDHGAASRV